MDLFFFLFLFATMLGCVAIGLKTGNPALLIIGSVLAIGLGLIVWSDGLISPKIIEYQIDDTNSLAPTEVTPIYETFTSDQIEINVLAWLLFGGGIIFLLFSVYYSAFGHTGEPEELGG